jgi:hypothetical protein
VLPRLVAVALFGLLVCSCKKTPEPPAPTPAPEAPATDAGAPPAAPAPQPAATPQPAADAGLPPVAITWVDPPEWKRSEKASMMRKASYVVPRAAGDKADGDLGVFYFGPGQGGGLEANVDRWVKQFKGTKLEDVKRADRNVGGLVAHTVEIASGTYDAGPMGGGDGKPKENYALLGAIVDAPSGSYFFKLVGPKATVAKAKKPFTALLDSIKTGN